MLVSVAFRSELGLDRSSGDGLNTDMSCSDQFGKKKKSIYEVPTNRDPYYQRYRILIMVAPYFSRF